MKRFILAGLLGAALPLTAQALEFRQVQPDKSALVFGYTQMGVPMEGRFQRFTAQLRFDPARPAAASTVLEVDLASIDTGTPEADAEVAGKQWFNTQAFPLARFASSAVKPLGGNRYQVAGKLTIKGRSRDIAVPVTFTPQGKQAVFAGAFSFKRADFAIGEGPWADFGTVANEVQIRFRILAVGQ